MRGNRGGNSAWGIEAAKTLWGEDWVARIENSFDSTVDWRASPANLASAREQARLARANGLTAAAAYRDGVADLLESALKQGHSLARQGGAPIAPPREQPTSPVTGKVFFLTDTACDSACLDFADLVRSLPGTTHIGEPTDADAVYIDNSTIALPSGLASLSYSLKAYRHRLRGNNQWYDPQVRWPGGEMTDETIAAWVRRLRQAP